jgi:hypothetical protein
MKQAIRENRQGKIGVADELLDLHPAVAFLRSRMEVCQVVRDPVTRCHWFIGYAPEFKPLELGQRPPEYRAIFTQDELTVIFSAVD